MLEQMKGNYLFPEEIEGKELFTAVKKEQMFQLAVKEQASFGIEMDMEQDTVSFHFREGEEELQEFCDIGFPRHGETEEYSGETFYYACGISLIAFCRKIRNITFFNSKIWQDILKNTTYHRCSYCPSIIDSFRIMNNTQSQYLRIFCRCKSQKRGNITICTSHISHTGGDTGDP